MDNYDVGNNPVQTPKGQREWKLIEKLVLSMQDEQRRQRRWSIFFRLMTFAYLGVLLALFVASFYMGQTGQTGPSSNKDHTAMVMVSGIITEGSDFSADRVTTGLRRAFEAEKSKAVMLRLNSPGGSPVQAAYIYREIQRLKGKHPDKEVYAVITDIGASGAYYIAAAADHIYVNPSSIVGSIGVIMGGFGFTDAIEKMGIERRMMTAGENKALLDPFLPLNEKHKEHFSTMLDQVHEQFIDAVKEGRGERLDLNRESELFSGLVWSGQDAIELGLADGFGSPGSVARDVIGTEDIVDYTAAVHPLERFMRGMGTSIGAGMGRMLGLDQQTLR